MKVYSVVSFSGGMDSATLLTREHYLAHRQGMTVRAFGFFYGSKHNPYEILAAREFAKSMEIQYDVLDLTNISAFLQSNLLKTGGDIPEGHYEAATMTQTVVPGRNTIFASILLGIAESIGADRVVLGAHSGDHAIYPDCRPNYFRYLSGVFEEASEGKVTLAAPFLDWDKEKILRLSYYGGMNEVAFPPLRVNYAKTRTCYKDQPIACGRCGACQERLIAFRALGIQDPAEYESRDILPA
jgi:7-cyano-7-deazaguanine synthase